MKILALFAPLLLSGCCALSGGNVLECGYKDVRAAGVTATALAPVWEPTHPDLAEDLVRCGELLQELSVYMEGLGTSLGDATTMVEKVDAILVIVDLIAVELIDVDDRATLDAFLATAQISLSFISIYADEPQS